MNSFIHDNFLLETDAASRLYHDYAANMPIVDYHNHLSPDKITANYQYNNITEMWLGGDHYKWRAMRSNGIPEEKITGNISPRERFRFWAETIPATLCNPLYHWAHMELARYFGITDKLLGPDTADEIYDRCNELIATDEFKTWNLMKKMKVEVICTTDDPTDSLEHHRALLGRKDVPFKMFPAWRPDRALKAEDPASFSEWVDRLEVAARMSIKNLRDFKSVLEKRHDYFHAQGCCISDYGLETIPSEDYTEAEISDFFSQLRAGSVLQGKVLEKYRSAMLHFLICLDAEKDWTMQLHIGVMRNNNSKMLQKLGPDTGYDSMGDFCHAKPLAKLLDFMDRDSHLPKTIIYPINPADNEMVATMIGNFQDGLVPGKMQFGAAWWFLDQLNGIENQMNALSAMGLLARFVGMTTDSRSVISFPRHEYFRRILCNVLGRDMKRGHIPADFNLVGSMVQDIAYHNAKKYFNFRTV